MVMHNVHLRALDLNLLVVLDALLAEHSATRAAVRLGLTQSAVSHALARLRDTLDDPLLVRGGGGLVPTPRADALRQPLRRLLDELTGLLRPPAFEPATATGTVTVAAADYATSVVVPALAARLATEAPGLDLRLRPPPADGPRALADGEIDLALDVPVPDADGLHARPVLEDGFVAVLRAGHPALAETWTVESFAALRHVLIAPRGTPGGPVDQGLAERGLQRRLVVTVPHFLAAPHVVARTDAVLTLPTRVAALVVRPLGLVTRPLPFDLGRFTLHAVWHERRHADPAHRWLREAVARAAQGNVPDVLDPGTFPR